MDFVKNGLDTSNIDDPVFAIAKRALSDDDPSVINATIGSLYDEDEKIVTYKTFFDIYDKIDDKIKAEYAESFEGNASYKEAVLKHVLNDSVKLPKGVLATSGGTGAISLVIKDFLKEDDTLILPDIAWSSYALMAKDFGLKVKTYDPLALDDLIKVIEEIAKVQDKVVVVINSPCHNPLGTSLSFTDWKKLIDVLNALSKPVILLDDIAYFDYAFDQKTARSYFELFNDINENVLVTIAFSMSKTMTAYGIRCGALILIHKDEKILRSCQNALARSCRSLWSNINNAAMIAFSKVLSDKYEAFKKEKEVYIKLLKERSEIFLKEAFESRLSIYPYQEGFFITVKCEDNGKRDLLHEALMAAHIYTVKVNRGIRIAICSIPKRKLSGMAKRIKVISDRIESQNLR